jgi:hypothetical protein
MRTSFKIVVASTVAFPLLGNPLATAQVAGATTVVPDTLCDYCKDYTDEATAAGDVRSTYRPGTGYAREPETAATPGANGTSDEYKRREHPAASEARAADKTHN